MVDQIFLSLPFFSFSVVDACAHLGLSFCEWVVRGC